LNVYDTYYTLAEKYKDDAVASVALEEAFAAFTIHINNLLKQILRQRVLH
jgi:hypothetical protein